MTLQWSKYEAKGGVTTFRQSDGMGAERMASRQTLGAGRRWVLGFLMLFARQAQTVSFDFLNDEA